MSAETVDQIISLCKRRGFIFPSSEIYGGFRNTYDYGPLGAQMKKNVKDLWWKMFVEDKDDIVGIDGAIFMNPKVWEASGHLGGFNDAMVDCKECKNRMRADHLIEDELEMDVEGKSMEEITKIIADNKLKCAKCGSGKLTEARHFNMMFQIRGNKIGDDDSSDVFYLRPETAQAIFVQYKNTLQTSRKKVPFGIAQIGKAFRNEITPGNFIFRTTEFEQMEIEYFIQEKQWRDMFDTWLGLQVKWLKHIGINIENIREYEHPKEKLSHYSRRTVDLEYKFPFGFKELNGLAYRTDYDLKSHEKVSGEKMQYVDPETNEKYIPHVIEPSWGVDRMIFALLCDAYEEDEIEGEKRVVLHLDPKVAPFKVAVLPLVNKLNDKANEVFEMLKRDFLCDFDSSGSIGKRYRRHDEIGTPWCVTIDHDTLEDFAVTIRDRDTLKQERVAIGSLKEWFEYKLIGS